MWIVGRLVERLRGRQSAKPRAVHWPPRRCDAATPGDASKPPSMVVESSKTLSDSEIKDLDKNYGGTD